MKRSSEKIYSQVPIDVRRWESSQPLRPMGNIFVDVEITSRHRRRAACGMNWRVGCRPCFFYLFSSYILAVVALNAICNFDKKFSLIFLNKTSHWLRTQRQFVKRVLPFYGSIYNSSGDRGLFECAKFSLLYSTCSLY